MKKEFPIIEYDGVSNNLISPYANVDQSIKLPARCVISFFGDAVRLLVNEQKLREIGSLTMESFHIPIYLAHDDIGNDVALIHGFGSGPYAAGQVEKLICLGCNKFMICGGCGVLEKGSLPGDIMIPVSAVRDEGTSYHYIEPSREIAMDASVVDVLCDYFSERNIPCKKVKTWTTDAMYRETVNMIAYRISEGCSVVEMECASFLAVAKYKNVKLGQVLYAGDDLSGIKWKSRNWKNLTEIRAFLLKNTINICGQLTN